jgi:multidrug efflux system membrane fusion protein
MTGPGLFTILSFLSIFFQQLPCQLTHRFDVDDEGIGIIAHPLNLKTKNIKDFSEKCNPLSCQTAAPAYKAPPNDDLGEGKLSGLIDKNAIEIYALSMMFLPCPLPLNGLPGGRVLGRHSKKSKQNERSMKRKDFAVTALPLWCIVFLSFFSGCSDENMAKAKPNAAVPVTVGTVLQKAIPMQLRAIGNAQAFSAVTVKALVGGELIKVNFREGQDVKQGDLLFVIDPRPYEATLRQAEANLGRDISQVKQAEANVTRNQAQVREAEANGEKYVSQVKQAKAALERDLAQVKQAEANLARDMAQARNAAVEAQRYKALVEKNVVSRQQYDQFRTVAETSEATVQADKAALQNAEAAVRASQAAVENAEAAVRAGKAAVENAEAAVRAGTASVENAEATVRANKAAVEFAKIQLGYCFVYSPLGGRTGNLIVQQGNIVKANDMNLVVINQITPMYVSFAVPEQHLAEIKKYMAAGKLKVEAVIPSDGNQFEEGILTFVDNAVDSSTGTIRLKGTFANREKRLWPGQFANVVLTLTTELNAIVAPSQAVQTGQDGQYVFVVKNDGTVESRPVVVGTSYNNEILIQKGLRPGETVVTDGQLRLRPGAMVEVKGKAP